MSRPGTPPQPPDASGQPADAAGDDAPGQDGASGASARGDIGLRSADLTTRAAARLVDLLLIAVTGSVLWFVGAALTGVADLGPRAVGLLGLVSQSVVSSLIGVAYFTFLEHRVGRTFGKAIVGTRVIGPDGGPPSLQAAFKRNAWLLLGIVPVLGGLATLAVVVVIAATISGSPLNRGWHDELAGGTAVVKGA